MKDENIEAQLERIRRYGKDRPRAEWYHEHAPLLLTYVQMHCSPVQEQTGCQTWEGDPHLSFIRGRMKLNPGEILWVVETGNDLPSNSLLWSTCGNRDCIATNHQQAVITLLQAQRDLTGRLGGWQEAQRYTTEWIRSGILRSVWNPHGRVEAFIRSEYDEWCASSAFEAWTPAANPFASIDYDLLIVFLRDNFDYTDSEEPPRPLFIPEGTTLIGRFEAIPPMRDEMWEITVENCRWTFGREDVALMCPLTRRCPPGAQAQIAADSLRQAKARQQKGQLDAAQRLYACAIIELEESGKTWADVASERLERAKILVQLARRDEALTEMCRIALDTEEASLDTDYARREQLDYVEHAITAHLLIAQTVADDPEKRQQATKAFEKAIPLLGRLKDRPAFRCAACVSLAEVALTMEDRNTATHAHDWAMAIYQEQLAQRSHRAQLAALSVRLSDVTAQLYAIKGDKWIPLQTPPQTIRQAEPLILYDLATVCACVFQEKVEPNKNGDLPKKIKEQLRLSLRGQPRAGTEGDRYPIILFEIANRLGLIKLRDPLFEDGKSRYVRGPQYVRWTQQDSLDQLRQLLDFWTKLPLWMDARGHHFEYADVAWQPLKARALLLLHLKQCDPEQWHDIRSLLYTLWNQHAGDLRLHEDYWRSSYGSRGAPTREQWEICEQEMYLGILASSLFEIGIVSLGYHQTEKAVEKTPNSPNAFSITSLGHMLLGQRQEREMPASKGIIVQPTFEILLLQQDFSALFALLPFARLLQVGVVSRLQLTKDSVLKGRATGLGSQEMLATLTRLNPKALPQNVEYTLSEWAKEYREAIIESVLLVEVSDDLAGDLLCRNKVLSARKLAPHIIAISTRNATLQELWRECEKEGIVIKRIIQDEI